jgi:hypothetical protein
LSPSLRHRVCTLDPLAAEVACARAGESLPVVAGARRLEAPRPLLAAWAGDERSSWALTDDKEQRMRVTQIIADLHVTDLKAAKGFHTDYLGLTEEEFTWRGSRATPHRKPGSTSS